MRLIRLGVFLVAVFAAASSHKPSAADAMANIRAQWPKFLHSKQLDQLAMLYAPDAAFLDPNGGRISGRPAIRELCKKVMETFTSDLTFHSITTEYSGDLAYDSGDFSETLVNLSDGSTSQGKGNYLMVFKRQPDGNWLIAQQVWTASTRSHE